MNHLLDNIKHIIYHYNFCIHNKIMTVARRTLINQNHYNFLAITHIKLMVQKSQLVKKLINPSTYFMQ